MLRRPPAWATKLLDAVMLSSGMEPSSRPSLTGLTQGATIKNGCGEYKFNYFNTLVFAG